MKRTIDSITNNTRSKRARIKEPADISCQKEEIVSATNLYHYMIKDPLIDWLKLSNRSGTRSSPAYGISGTFTEFITKRGIEFEKELVRYIDQNLIPVKSVSSYINEDTLQKTKDFMFEGIPIIHSAPLFNKTNNTQGVADLLVRSDYLMNLINVEPLTDIEKNTPSPTLGVNYHYVVIDIKFSTLPLRADGKHLLNSGSYPAYKAQCLIYTEAVGLMQGYTPPYAFIMGRRWRCSEKGVNKNNYTCLDRLGRIDYENIDKEYKTMTIDAINWVRDVRKNGKNWIINPPSRVELYPNMCVDSGIWNGEKEKIAEKIGEMTNIWFIGIKHRNNAVEKGVSSWRDYACTTELMKFNGTRAPTVDAILNINRQVKDKILPTKIESNLYQWKDTDSPEIYVDFETLSDIFADFNHLPEQSCTDMIFMIGVGWEENKKWRYKNFICNSPTFDEEFRIMDEFVTFVRDFNNPKMFHWCAEERFWKSAECRQFDIACGDENEERKEQISTNWKLSGWSDLCILFQSVPIVVKDCFKFGLKKIAKAMKKHGLIKTSLESDCDSGMTAMTKAWKAYNTYDNPVDCDIMKDIAKYNEFDTKVLWEILLYLRNHHS